MLVTSILGRPCASSLPGHDKATLQSVILPSEDRQGQAFGATYDVCLLIEKLMQDSSQTSIPNPVSAESFLVQLGAWSANLRPVLREFRSANGTMDSMSRALVIGSVHNACVYYFAIFLVTRPFLIIELTSRIASRESSNQSAGPDMRINPKYAALTQACIDSAVYLVQICHETLESGILLANMCILK